MKSLKLYIPASYGMILRSLTEIKKLVLKSDISKDRLIYFGNEVEIFTYKGNGWFNNKLDLFRKNELIVSIKSKEFFKTKYMIEVENDFENYVVILTFLSSYISSQGS